MFVLFIAGQPMTGQRMFESDEEEDADWQVILLLLLFYITCFCRSFVNCHYFVLYTRFSNTNGPVNLNS